MTSDRSSSRRSWFFEFSDHASHLPSVTNVEKRLHAAALVRSPELEAKTPKWPTPEATHRQGLRL